MKYTPYPKYKDSGIEWLGEIPYNWCLSMIKWACRIAAGATPKTDTTEYWDGDIKWATPTDLGFDSKRYIEETKRSITAKGLESCACELAPSNSIILSTRAPIGSIGINKVEMAFNQGCKALIPGSRINTNYIYYYLLGHKEQLQLQGKGTTFPELSYDELMRFPLPHPSLHSQRAIAAFLDAETARIDGLIKDYEDLIELLKEKRQALISHAVTRGLSELVSPDDPEFGEWAKPVKFKDSGVEWIGEIPEGWDASKIGYLTSFASGATPSKDNDSFWNGNIPWVSPKDLKVKEIWDSEDHVSELAVTECGLKLVPAGTLLIVVRGMILIRDFPVAITMTPVTINQDMKAVQVRDPIGACFLHLYLVGIKGQILSFFIDEAAHGTLAIRMDVFKALPVLLPPKAEQKAIASFRLVKPFSVNLRDRLFSR